MCWRTHAWTQEFLSTSRTSCLAGASRKQMAAAWKDRSAEVLFMLCRGGMVTSYHGALPDCSPQVLGGSAEEVCDRAVASSVPLSAVMSARYYKKAWAAFS